MKEPSLTTIKRLFALSNNKCAFPGCSALLISESGTVVGKICHIHARSPGGARYESNQTDEERNSFSNLVLLCGQHHDTIDKEPDVYTAAILWQMKQFHESKGRIEIQPEDSIFAEILLNDYKRLHISNNSGNIIVNSPGAVQAKVVNINAARKNVKILPPEGTISTDLKMKGYVKHLIDRYNEFAGNDPTRRAKYSYAAIYANIKSKFGVTWDMVPTGRFTELAVYLQQRINRTRQACMNKGKGYKAFSTFDEFCEKHRLN